MGGDTKVNKYFSVNICFSKNKNGVLKCKKIHQIGVGNRGGIHPIDIFLQTNVHGVLKRKENIGRGYMKLKKKS